MKALVLLSGGIDSPVAMYELIQDGWDVAALHMDNRPFTDDTYIEKVKMLVEQVEKVTGRTIPLYVADHGRNQTTIARKLSEDGEATTRGLQCVLCKRQMYRTAEAIAREVGAHAIATGESLGQVASQTMHNLAVEDDAISFPMVRPLLGLDKEDIIEVARRIGTFEVSTIPSLCCSILPDRPATHSSLDRVLPYEEQIGAGELLKVSMANLKGPAESRDA
ncbi:MAG: 7-cyano-7-deazaguanine synthase [Euryarchaeota archaeon]|nr:7-cyano-7-deazaguanine synthase [Euryarchaeota archaeon]